MKEIQNYADYEVTSYCTFGPSNRIGTSEADRNIIYGLYADVFH